jgi:hypothetical protein
MRLAGYIAVIRIIPGGYHVGFAAADGPGIRSVRPARRRRFRSSSGQGRGSRISLRFDGQEMATQKNSGNFLTGDLGTKTISGYHSPENPFATIPYSVN